MKAWRCRACDHWLHKAAQAAAVKYNPNANNGCDYYEDGKCTIDFPDTIHDNCDLEPVTITLLADYEAQQAALAAAEAKFTAIRLAATDNELNELVSETQMIDLVNQIRAAQKVNEEAE